MVASLGDGCAAAGAGVGAGKVFGAGVVLDFALVDAVTVAVDLEIGA